MRIKLDSEFTLVGDSDQVTLVQVRVTQSGPNAGQKKDSPVGYYADVPQAVEAFATRKARMSDVSTLREYIQELRVIREEIRLLCREAA